MPSSVLATRVNGPGAALDGGSRMATVSSTVASFSLVVYVAELYPTDTDTNKTFSDVLNGWKNIFEHN